jgi:rod shape-determining protein MreD
MSLSSARPLDPWRWLGAPLLMALVATVVFAAPIRIFGLPLPEPVFALAPTFAWAVIRPAVLAPFLVLLMGLFLDLFWGGPLGLWGLSLLIAYGVSLFSRSMMTGQSRAMMLVWYATVCAFALVAGYLMTMLDSLAAPSLLAVFWQFLATLTLFPFANRLIDRFDDADVRFR